VGGVPEGVHSKRFSGHEFLARSDASYDAGVSAHSNRRCLRVGAQRCSHHPRWTP